MIRQPIPRFHRSICSVRHDISGNASSMPPLLNFRQRASRASLDGGREERLAPASIELAALALQGHGDEGFGGNENALSGPTVRVAHERAAAPPQNQAPDPLRGRHPLGDLAGDSLRVGLQRHAPRNSPRSAPSLAGRPHGVGDLDPANDAGLLEGGPRCR